MRADPEIEQLDVSKSEFEQGRARRFGTSNPECVREPFWEAMIRSGVNAYQAGEAYEVGTKFDGTYNPIWCAQRFGQSITFLPDGRIVLVGGEHEDHYDPDFCIYNDVIVFNPGGEIMIYGYPEADFPPTDFHTATLVGHHIYLIGSLGYQSKRLIGETPVYRLDTRTFHIERINTAGDKPGWIFMQQATLSAPNLIKISGGSIEKLIEEKAVHDGNTQTFILDVDNANWRNPL